MDIEGLAHQIRDLERKINDLDYDLHRAKLDLESDIRQKADKKHSHGDCD